MKIMRSPVGRARGLGAAKEGAAHWWGQRISAIALVPLTVWFVIAVISLSRADHATLVAWFDNPGNATLMALLVFTTFYHGQLGLQVVIEDYVHSETAKTAGLIALRLVTYLLGAYCLVSVFKVAFGG